MVTKPDKNIVKEDTCFILTASQVYESSTSDCDGNTHDEFEILTNEAKCARIISVHGVVYCLTNAHVLTNDVTEAQAARQNLGGFLPEVETWEHLFTLRNVSGNAEIIWLGRP